MPRQQHVAFRRRNDKLAPRVSVVMPVHQAATTVVAAAHSILHGSFRDLELLVVDDGRTDGSADRVAALAAADSRVHLERCVHRGVAAAANGAVAAARAPLIARMDADDVAHPERLARQVEALERDDVDVVGTQVNVVDAGGKAVPSMLRYERWSNELIEPARIAAMRFVELPLVNPTLLGRRAVFDLGYRDRDESGAPIPEDYDWFLRALSEGYRFGKVAKCLLDWVDSPRRLSRCAPGYDPAAFLRARRAHLRAGPLRAVPTVDLWGAGKTGKPWLRWLLDSGVAVRRLYDIDRRKVGNAIAGHQVEHPDSLARADGTPLLIAVGAEGAREVIEPQLAAAGHGLGRDAWFVA